MLLKRCDTWQHRILRMSSEFCQKRRVRKKKKKTQWNFVVIYNFLWILGVVRELNVQNDRDNNRKP